MATSFPSSPTTLHCKRKTDASGERLPSRSPILLTRYCMTASQKIAGWSDDEIQTVEVPAGQSRTFKFAPSFLPRLYHNHEISAATARVEVSDSTGRSTYEGTIPVRLRSVDDMYWGTNFKYAPFIASWVTPH